MIDVDVEVLPHQCELASDVDADILALEGGLGCGKTVAGIIKMLERVAACPGVPGLWIEPTHDLIGSILLATIDELFEQWGVPYEYRTAWRGRRDVLLIYPGEPNETPVYLRSGEKPERIVGFKVGWFIVDEADQMDADVWRRAGQRLRDARVERRQQIAVFTPEEGFNWTHKVFHEDAAPDGLTRRVIQGVHTGTNVFNPGDYLARLGAGLTEDELQRVLTGKRTHRSGLVYSRFEHARHARPCSNPLAGRVVIGADFNLSPMVWLFGRHLGHELHIWGELVGEYVDTIEMGRRALDFLAETYREHGQGHVDAREIARTTELVPDASCSQRRTANDGTASDLDHLIRAGFDVRRPSRNPPIRDRVFSVNLGLHEDRIFVDAERCPLLYRSLTQQPWNSLHNEPDKAHGLDHAPDALGYLVHYYEPAHAPRGNALRAA